jgi:hypothetical protein
MHYFRFSPPIITHDLLDQACYEKEDGCFAVYGFEYKPGFDDAFITWLNDGKKAWTVKAAATVADPNAEIGSRPVPQEPMVRAIDFYSAIRFPHRSHPNSIYLQTLECRKTLVLSISIFLSFQQKCEWII